MAKKSAILAVRIVADSKDARKGLKQTEDSVKALEKTSIAAAAAFAAIAAGAYQAFQSASELEQATGAVASVYGQYATQVERFAKQAADAVGLSESKYKQMAAVFGSQLKNMGVAQDEVAEQTNELIELGADLAATYGGTTADAVAALSSLLRGERDPIERYGVSIKQSDINARLAAEGLDKLTGEARRQAELQATLGLLTAQTADAQGQFARESDTAAGAMQRMNAKWEEASAALGEALLPLMVTAAEVGAGMAEWVADNSELLSILAGVIGGVAGAILLVNGAMAAYRAIAAAAAAVQLLLNAAFVASPLGWVALAIAAVVAAVVLVIEYWEELVSVAQTVWGAILDFMQPVIDAIGAFVQWVQEAVVWVGKLFSGELFSEWWSNTFGGPEFIYAPHMTPVGDPAFDALVAGTGPWPVWPADLGSSSSNQPTTVVNITVNGALDPEAVARQINDLLDIHLRTQGVLQPGGRLR